MARYLVDLLTGLEGVVHHEAVEQVGHDGDNPVTVRERRELLTMKPDERLAGRRGKTF